MSFNRLTVEQTIAVHTRLTLLEVHTMTLAETTLAIAEDVDFDVTESNVKRIADAVKLSFKGARGPRAVDSGVADDVQSLARVLRIVLHAIGPTNITLPHELAKALDRMAAGDKAATGTLFDATV